MTTPQNLLQQLGSLDPTALAEVIQHASNIQRQKETTQKLTLRLQELEGTHAQLTQDISRLKTQLDGVAREIQTLEKRAAELALVFDVQEE